VQAGFRFLSQQAATTKENTKRFKKTKKNIIFKPIFDFQLQ